MCYITSASLEPCDCYPNCERCGEALNDDTMNETPRLGAALAEVLCDDCYAEGVECEGCEEESVSWERAAHTNAVYGCPLCEGCEKESEV